MDEKWLFVINPKSGRKKRFNIPALIKQGCEGKIRYEIIQWDDPFDFSSIRNTIVSGNYKFVVAAGGDGTVNRVGAAVLETEVTLGILPLGSGNGLARTLGLNMQVSVALEQLLAKNIQQIDVATVNGRPYFCTAGVGFDAHIGGLFAHSESRGLRSYIQIVVRELLRYRALTYSIDTGSDKFTERAFLITLANAGQYGNDFYIAPQASLQDGKLQLVILKPFNILKAAGILRRILGRQAHLSPSIKTLASSHVTISRESEGLIHFDGEPAEEGRDLVFGVKPLGLRVLTGAAYTGVPGNGGRGRVL